MPTRKPEEKSRDSSAAELDLPAVPPGEEPLDHPEPSIELQFRHAMMLLRSRCAVEGGPARSEKIETTERFVM